MKTTCKGCLYYNEDCGWCQKHCTFRDINDPYIYCRLEDDDE